MKMPVVTGTCTDSIKGHGDTSGLATYGMNAVIHEVFARLAQGWALSWGWSLREALKKWPSHPLPKCTLQLRAMRGKQGETVEGRKLSSCVFKATNPRWCAQSALLCCNHRRARLERGRFCFPAGLRKMVAPVIGYLVALVIGGGWWHPNTLCHKKEEACWIDMFILKSSIHNVRWWRSQGAPLSCQPSA